MTWSVIVHLLLAGSIIVIPRDWYTRKKATPNIMTISLGGSAGPVTTGTTAAGGRTVEKVAPPDKRPEPIRPVPKQEPAATPVKSTARPDTSKEVAAIKPAPPPTRPPTTGARVVAGSTPVDTGARGQSVGLTTTGGGGSGGEADLMNFCCPEYVQHLLSEIESRWVKNQPEHGNTLLKFTIHRDGTITDISVERGSGSGVLDRIAKNALTDARLMRLPREYTKETLTIHLTFPYGTQ
ncbi:MAG: TonB family protein [Vicinamibacterales bacterium]